MSRGSLTKRGDSWMLKWERDPDPETRKRRYGYATVQGSKKAAQSELTKRLSEKDQGATVDPNRLTVAQWVEIWLRDYGAKWSQRTREGYSHLLQYHVVPRLGSTLLQKLGEPELQALYSYLRREGSKPKSSGQKGEPRGLSEQTMLHVHRALSLCLSKAVKGKRIVRNPIADIDTPKPHRNGRKLVEVLEREQLFKLVSGFRDHPLFVPVAIATGTGLRRGEILGLRSSDVDLERGRLRVHQAVEETKLLGVQIKEPKNKSSIRDIGIDPKLTAILKRWMVQQSQDWLKLGIRPGPDALLFPLNVSLPTTPKGPRNVTAAFKARAKRLGFPQLHMHVLRHTHASQLLNGGTTINAVAYRLGHSTPVITLSVYGHLLRNSEDIAVAVAGSLLEGATDAA